ncbi:MAG: class I SAM-dependent methyltransferase, partial [Planctomycetota bacterium]
MPTSQELADYYESSFTDGMYSTFTAADEMKRMTADQRLKEIKRDIDIQGRWMDVGCANGVFTKAMVDQGIDASGVEISAHAVAAARQQGLQVMAGTIDDVPLDHGYDGMTAFDVLEHVISPTQFLASIHKRLRVGGHVVLTVPDTGTLVRKLMGSRSFFYIPEEHLHYFDSRNLAA